VNHQQSRLEIIGFDNEPIHNTFHQQAEPTSTLGLVFPGIGYSVRMPVLYYSSKILLGSGLDVLEVEYNYRRLSFQNEPEDERLHWILTDAANAYHAANARGTYKKLVAVGKSIGTIAMLSLLDEPGLQPAKYVWITPLLKREDVRSSILSVARSSLVIIGTNDQHYDEEYLAALEGIGAEVLVLENADHSLEIEHDLFDGLDGLRSGLELLEGFIT
jgi:predicted alpha/beta-hydrolase family hydrolase